jgi:hypothetical protein
VAGPGVRHPLHEGFVGSPAPGSVEGLVRTVVTLSGSGSDGSEEWFGGQRRSGSLHQARLAGLTRWKRRVDAGKRVG